MSYKKKTNMDQIFTVFRSKIFIVLFINIAKLIINLVILNRSRIQNQIRIKI